MFMLVFVVSTVCKALNPQVKMLSLLMTLHFISGMGLLLPEEQSMGINFIAARMLFAMLDMPAIGYSMFLFDMVPALRSALRPHHLSAFIERCAGLPFHHEVVHLA
jgi:hypothetical protein